MRAFSSLLCLLLLPGATFSAYLSDIFARVDPAVVVLHTYSDAPLAGKVGQTGTAKGLGSGVIISDDGKVVTAAHVVHSVDTVHVELADGKKVIGRVLSSEPAADLALLQMDPLPDHFVAAELGDSDQVRVGQEVFVIGAPYGLAHTLSGGHISARHARGKADNPFFRGEFLQKQAKDEYDQAQRIREALSADRIVLELEGQLQIVPMSAVKRLHFAPAPATLPDWVIKGVTIR